MYLALYRKFRPKNFDQVIGQDHITTTLKNQIANDQISHAYLFCGTRGTGKTSVAKVFAQSINCEHPKNGNPCGTCNTCKALSEPGNIDILEIDAASNNRVDEIRELREKVKYPPVNGKYKVYIIDEVHMLTDSAFNALLKTLEEPPHYVVFILATTEVQKLPATILSRCLRFDFKLVSNEDLEKHLKTVFDASNVAYEPEALALLARLGEGSVRDTLSVADMVVAYTNKNVTYEGVLACVGAIDKTQLFELGATILQKDATTIMPQINAIVESGKNVSQLAKDLAQYYRDLAVVKTTQDAERILAYPKNLLQVLTRVAKEYDMKQILFAMKAFASLENEFRNTNQPRLLLELTALSVLEDETLLLKERIKKLEQAQKKTKTAELSVSDAQIKVVELEGSKPKKVAPKKQPSLNQLLETEVSLVKPTTETEHVFAQMKQTTAQTNKTQKVLGKLLVALREQNELSLHSLLGTQANIVLDKNVFYVGVSNETKQELLQKPENTNLINTLLQQQNPELELKVLLQQQEEEKTVDAEDYLKQLFGKKLTILK